MRKSRLKKVAFILGLFLFAGGLIFAADIVVTGTLESDASLAFGSMQIALGTLAAGVEKTGTVTITESTNNSSAYTVTVASAQLFNLRAWDGSVYVNTGLAGEVIPYTFAYGVAGSELLFNSTGQTSAVITDSNSKPHTNSVTKISLYM